MALGEALGGYRQKSRATYIHTLLNLGRTTTLAVFELHLNLFLILSLLFLTLEIYFAIR